MYRETGRKFYTGANDRGAKCSETKMYTGASDGEHSVLLHKHNPNTNHAIKNINF
jgi:hypothetical protein